MLDGVEETSLVIFNDIFKIMQEEFSKPAGSESFQWGGAPSCWKLSVRAYLNDNECWE